MVDLDEHSPGAIKQWPDTVRIAKYLALSSLDVHLHQTRVNVGQATTVHELDGRDDVHFHDFSVSSPAQALFSRYLRHGKPLATGTTADCHMVQMDMGCRGESLARGLVGYRAHLRTVVFTLRAEGSQEINHQAMMRAKVNEPLGAGADSFCQSVEVVTAVEEDFVVDDILDGLE
jgi:hypothetical protein